MASQARAKLLSAFEELTEGVDSLKIQDHYRTHCRAFLDLYCRNYKRPENGERSKA